MTKKPFKSSLNSFLYLGCTYKLYFFYFNLYFYHKFQSRAESKTHNNGGDAGAETDSGEHQDSEQRQVSRGLREEQGQIYTGMRYTNLMQWYKDFNCIRKTSPSITKESSRRVFSLVL